MRLRYCPGMLVELPSPLERVSIQLVWPWLVTREDCRTVIGHCDVVKSVFLHFAHGWDVHGLGLLVLV